MRPMTGQLESLYELKKRDVRRAAGVLTDAFEHDPIWNAILRDATPTQRVGAFETPLRYCRRYGQVFATSAELEGVAAWLPGDSSAFTPWRLLWSGAMGAALKLGWKTARKMEPIFAPLELYRKDTMSDEPFVYLQIIGVAKAMQGRGFGSTILRALIGECDRTGKSLYLETETEDNVAFYERFGFGVVRQITLPMVDLPMWLMVRSAGKPVDRQ
ncbi:MAG: GNAT family N-acetyltransferase [Spirochaetaceae bacterium]|nr:MAG: GNAT family N-acetyltransferase [Spirochaetaceae bacterium]